jgi:hypothetical protein
MKAHVVKGNVLAVVFSFGRALVRGRAGRGSWANRIASSPSFGFVLRPWLARVLVSS